MCGVFGFIGRQGIGPCLDTLQAIAAVTERRGKHAFGFAWIDKRGLHSFRSAGRITDHLALLELARNASMLIGHCRYATQGEPQDNINNHPHPCDGGWIVHNGIVRNYTDLLINHQLHVSSACDSEAIALLAEQAQGTRVQRLRTAVNLTTPGPLVVLGLWARPAKLVVVKRGNPLQISETETGTYIASLSDGMPIGCATLKDNRIFSFGAANGKVYPLATNQNHHVPSHRGAGE